MYAGHVYGCCKHASVFVYMLPVTIIISRVMLRTCLS